MQNKIQIGLTTLRFNTGYSLRKKSSFDADFNGLICLLTFSGLS
jgi:hypothetical protein